jgi:Zn-dependent peptidase ImmA (M78 family)
MWREHQLSPGFDIEALLDRLNLALLWEAIPDGRVLGQLNPSDELVVLNQKHYERLEANGGRVRRYTIAHEIGHWCFHCDAARSGTLSLFEDGRIWCRAGDTHPAERQAEMFAARLLMPEFEVRPRVPAAPWSGWRVVRALADTFLVSQQAMMIRLEELRLGHDCSGVPTSGRAKPPGQGELF